MAYSYFLVTRRDFTYENELNRVMHAEKYKLIEQAGFNHEKYDRLVRDADRWQRFSRALMRR